MPSDQTKALESDLVAREAEQNSQSSERDAWGDVNCQQAIELFLYLAALKRD
jgi:hypothetical protein